MNTMMKQTDLFENSKYKPNNIYNVDCYKAIKEIPDKSIDSIYVDIPYLYDNGGGGYSELSKRIVNKKNSLVKISKGIDYEIFDQFIRISKKVNIFIWCSKLQLLDIMNYFIGKGYFFELLVWHKTNPTPSTNNVWLPDLEYCLYFRESGVRLNNGYELKSKCYVSGLNQKEKDEYEHPTIKPLEMVKKHILHTTQENDVVLDCFLGSGTTAVACKELGRKYIGFEIDENYFKIAQDRLNGVTQKDRKAEENGITNIFDFLE